jgi:hypothetical protein
MDTDPLSWFDDDEFEPEDDLCRKPRSYSMNC